MAPGTHAADHLLNDDEANVHRAWDRDLDPVLTVEPGEVVRFECRGAADGQVTPESGAEVVPALAESEGHPLTGPVAVEGAEPGDVLAVELLDLEHEGFGYSFFFPGEMGTGLLPDEFDEPGLFWWELADGVARFADGIEVPLDPFPGVVGLAPDEPGPLDTVPPRSVGGNLDVKHLTAGSTLYLPVAVEDALFSIGDCHAAQGDGEVCVTGIEAPMTVTARLDLREGADIDGPQFETTGPFTPTGADEPTYGTSGIDPDLMEATKEAVRHMIDHLHEERGLTREEGYVLCSATVDLKINQVVDAPNWTVSAYLPESIFPEEQRRT